jgi:rhomboid protease GluP
MSDDTGTPAPLPWITIGFIAFLIGVFLAQQAGAQLFAFNGNLKKADLLAFGAMNPDLVSMYGEWWRLATATLLHAGWAHIALNAFVLFFAGRFIESHLGGATVTGIWALGALAGAMCSYLIGDIDRVSVGASGGIMALIAAALLLCYKLPPEAATLSGKSIFARVLIPSLIPTHAGTDYAGHFGGAVMGVLLALVLADVAYLARDNLHRRVVGIGATAIFLGMALFGAAQLVRLAPAFDPHAPLMIPVPADAPEELLYPPEPRAAELMAQYPGDPDVRMRFATALYNAGKPAEAEWEARIAYHQERIYDPVSSYALVGLPELRALIALGELAEGRRDKAAALIEPVCFDFRANFAKHLKLTPQARSLCP